MLARLLGRRVRRPSAAMIPTDATLIFLDVDGVLNSRASRDTGDHLPADEPLAHLVHLMSSLQCGTIVLSSTWRLDAQLREALHRVLAIEGLSFVSVTPDLEITHTGDRVDEIMAWLSAHRSADHPWIAIDDLDLLGMNPKLHARNFVRTSDGVGLTRRNVNEAVRKLSEQRAETRNGGGSAPPPTAPSPPPTPPSPPPSPPPPPTPPLLL